MEKKLSVAPKITQIQKKIAEFKYKILLSILVCGQKVNKWGKNVSAECAFCTESEDIWHMLYSCPSVKHVWSVLSNCLKLNIMLKHVILCIPYQNYFSYN